MTPLASRRVLVLIVLAAHSLLLLHSSRQQFATRNEVAHLPAGLAAWETGRFSLYRVSPPLWRMVAVLPARLAKPYTGGIEFVGDPVHREEWRVARRFADMNALDYLDLICLARLAGIAWSMLGGWLICRWAGEIYGARAGLLALFLWCFEPNVLAHAQLLTPDMPATVAALAATYSFWLYLRQPDVRHAVLAGFLLGVAQLTKFTLLVLYPVWAALALASWACCNPAAGAAGLSPRIPFAGNNRQRLADAILITGLSLLVVNAGYAFDGTLTRLGDYGFVSWTFRGDIGGSIEPPKTGNRFAGAWLGTLPVPLPADYVSGIDVQRRDFEGGVAPSFLAGEWRDHGWWYYYLYALAVKVPLGSILLVFWSLLLLFLRRHCNVNRLDELALWLPALAVLTLVSSQTGFSHHMRYVLPAFPFVVIATSKLAYFMHAGRWKFGLLVLVLLAWSVGSSLTVYPHSLSYFNELVGGPDHGHKYLLNSNIDWGQDLMYLKKWAEKHPEARPLALAYSNFVDYRVCGAEFGKVPIDAPLGRGAPFQNSAAVGPHPGYFALDLHSLTRGNYKYFSRFQPIAKAGYSIFIYHISLEQAADARKEMDLEQLPNTPEKLQP